VGGAAPSKFLVTFSRLLFTVMSKHWKSLIIPQNWKVDFKRTKGHVRFFKVFPIFFGVSTKMAKKRTCFARV